MQPLKLCKDCPLKKLLIAGEVPKMSDVMLVSELCDMLKCGRDLIYRWIDEKKIAGVRLTPCGAWRIDRASVVKYLKEVAIGFDFVEKRPSRDDRIVLSALVEAGVAPPQTLVDRVHGRNCGRNA